MADLQIPFHKVVLLGEAAVGKTSIRRSYMGHAFKTQYISTIGTELSFYESDKMNLSIWDLAGEPNFSSVRKTFYQGAVGVIAVFDITRPDTLTKLDDWFNEFKDLVPDDIVIVLAGNKIDLEESGSTVSDDEFSAFVQERKGSLNIHDETLYTSAKTGLNIDQLFDILIRKIQELTDKHFPEVSDMGTEKSQ